MAILPIVHLLVFWAHRRSAATGLSAPIFAPQKFRSYPLRCPKTASLPFSGFDFLHSKKSRNYYSRHPCRRRQAHPCGFLSPKFLLHKNFYGFIAAGIPAGGAEERHPCRFWALTFCTAKSQGTTTAGIPTGGAGHPGRAQNPCPGLNHRGSFKTRLVLKEPPLPKIVASPPLSGI
jgi:hypothetical protein